jgi:hypothetical protein
MATPIEQLRHLAQKHPWVFDELVIDQKMIEANDLCNGSPADKVRFLEESRTRSQIVSQGMEMVRSSRLLKGLHLDKYEHLKTSKKKKR